MSQFKPRVDYSQESDGDLSPIARNSHDKMVLNAATFATPPILMPAYLITITTYEDALAKAANRGKAETNAKNEARLNLEGSMRVLAHYVDSIAHGVEATVLMSGFPGYQTGHSTQRDKGMVSNVEFVPEDLRLSQGNGSGMVACRWKSDGSRTGCELQTTTGAPDTEAGWTYKGSFTGGRADLSGYTPGAIVWGRVRKIGRNGETGPWSDPAKVMVT